MTLAERLYVLEQSIRDEGHREFANTLQALAGEAEKLEKAVVTFDIILFPTDGDRDLADTAHMREQLVNDLAESMERHGWAGDAEENVRFIERLANILKEGR